MTRAISARDFLENSANDEKAVELGFKFRKKDGPTPKDSAVDKPKGASAKKTKQKALPLKDQQDDE